MKSGELFAGAGGLGMAVDRVFGSRPSWFCEFDTAPSRVLAHHFPDVPNFGDVTAVDWKSTPRVDILAGGFPCQDVSLAGRRRGMGEGTRSGLWSEYAKAIDEIRPDWVVIENVRGLLSADATNGDMEPCPLCVGDNPGHVLRALGAVLGDLADLGFDAEWTGIRASDIGAPHGRFRVFILAWPAERTVEDSGSGRGRWGATTPGRGEGARADAPVDGADPRDDRTPEAARLNLLPTPEAKLASSGPDYARMNREGSGGDDLITTLWREGMHLLPTPVAQPSGNTPEEHLRKKPGRGVVTDLAIIAENGLIETGGRLHASSEGRPGEVLPGVRGTARQEAIRQRSPGGSGSVSAEEALLAELREHEGANSGRLPQVEGAEVQEAGDLRSMRISRAEVAHSSRGSEPGEQRPGQFGDTVPELPLEAALGGRSELWPEGVQWGPYEPAIRRWEAILGRPAPNPVTYDGRGGKPRLNPELCEFMMGWPAGHVTNPDIGLTRAEQLKACGNGVVPEQAAAALRELLARPGVPRVAVQEPGDRVGDGFAAT